MPDAVTEKSPSKQTSQSSTVLSNATNKTNGSLKKKVKATTSKLRRSNSFDKPKNGDVNMKNQQISSFFQKLSSPKFEEKSQTLNESIEDFDVKDDTETKSKSEEAKKKDKTKRKAKKKKGENLDKTNVNNSQNNKIETLPDEDNESISKDKDVLKNKGSKNKSKDKNLSKNKESKDKEGNHEKLLKSKQSKDNRSTDEDVSKREESKEVVIVEIDGKENANIAPKKTVNAFQFMMDARNKSIGSNSPGKEADKDVIMSPKNEVKEKLNERKQKLEKWANEKGGFKRKIEDEERGEVIKEKLNVRAKRFKKMLSESEKKKLKNKKDTDEYSSEDEDFEKDDKSNKKKILKTPVQSTKKTEQEDKNNLQQTSSKKMEKDDKNNLKKTSTSSKKIEQDDENNLKKTQNLSTDPNKMDQEDKNNKGKSSNLTKSPKKQVDLLNFVQSKPVKEDKSDSEQEVIKIKMFSSKVLKKKKKSKKSKNKSSDKEDGQENKEEKSSDSEDEFSIENTNVEDKVNELTNDVLKSKIRQLKKKRKVLTKKKLRPIPKIRIKMPSSDDETYSIISENSNVDDVEISSESVNLCDITEEDSVVIVEDEEQNVRRSTRQTTGRKSYADYVLSDDESEKKKSNNKVKTNVKLAPVFANAAPKPKIDPEILQARQDFLHSGVPSTLKKFIQQKQVLEELEAEIFPVISHVNQKPDDNEKSTSIDYWNLPKVELNLKEFNIKLPPVKYKDIIHLRNGKINEQKVDIRHNERISCYKGILKQIKEDNENYPVYRSFKQLSIKCGRSFETPDSKVAKKKGRRSRKSKELNKTQESGEKSLMENKETFAMWTEKYKPMSSTDILGNYKSIAEVRKWLQSWVEYSHEVNVKKRKRHNSSSSEFDTTDGESRDSFRLINNTIIITGPYGSGKSTAIYAICNELGINVLELNASSKRTGKRLLQELQEATQSHQVRNKPSLMSSFLQNKETCESSKNSTNLKNTKKVTKKDETVSTESKEQSRKMCLLLVEDIDIVFDQDDGFISAVSQLLSSSKRPIVLVASDTSCSHLYRFVNQYRTIEFGPLSSRVLAPWLQILCLVEGLFVDQVAMKLALELNKGDVRKTLLQLQFWIQSGGDDRNLNNTNKKSTKSKKRTSNKYKNSKQTEKSFLNCLTKNQSTFDEGSEVICEDIPEESLIKIDNTISENVEYLHKNLQPILNQRFNSFQKVNLGDCWRSFSYNLSELNDKTDMKKKVDAFTLSQIAEVCDSLSFTDFVYRKNKIETCDFTSQFYRTSVKDSLELGQCMESCRNHVDFVCEVTNELVKSSFQSFQRSNDLSCEFNDSSIEQERWNQEQHSCSEKFFEILPLSSCTDRKSFALDFFPCLQSIAKSESNRSSSTIKRNNRFYNYLESLGLSLNEKVLKTAQDVFANKN